MTVPGEIMALRDRIAEMWPAQTAEQIAATLGLPSRSAVLGHISRARANGDMRFGQPDTKKRNHLRPRAPQTADPPARALAPSLSAIALIWLPRQCRWIAGDAADGTLAACTARQVAGSSYCAHHEHRAHDREPTKVFAPRWAELRPGARWGAPT